MNMGKHKNVRTVQTTRTTANCAVHPVQGRSVTTPYGFLYNCNDRCVHSHVDYQLVQTLVPSLEASRGCEKYHCIVALIGM